MTAPLRALTLAVALAAASLPAAADWESTKAKIEAAMTADIRSEAEKERDSNRRPVETLEFFGFRDDMKVVELIPGGGWYTKILAPVLAEDGEYYAALGTGRIERDLVGQPGFGDMNIVAEDARIFREEGARRNSLEADGLGVEDADLVLTFRNYHNFGAEGRAAMNRAAYDALKPGGIYGVVDHTRRHMQSDDPENGRRVDPVLAIKEIQDAGFRLVDYSTLHYRADDELRYEVGRKTVTGNTDRFTLKFIKE
jgi:predicted methyltransferase